MVAAAARTAVTGILLSGTGLSLDRVLSSALAEAVAGCTAPVFVGGPLAEAHAQTLASLGVQPLGQRFRQALDRLDGHLAGRQG